MLSSIGVHLAEFAHANESTILASQMRQSPIEHRPRLAALGAMDWLAMPALAPCFDVNRRLGVRYSKAAMGPSNLTEFSNSVLRLDNYQDGKIRGELARGSKARGS
jgi:hypothetical protein